MISKLKLFSTFVLLLQYFKQYLYKTILHFSQLHKNQMMEYGPEARTKSVPLSLQYSAMPFITWSISSKIFTKDTHSLPVRVRYGVSFVGPASEWYFAWVPAIIYAISYYTGPHYNSTQLYIGQVSLYLHEEKLQLTLLLRCPVSYRKYNYILFCFTQS